MRGDKEAWCSGSTEGEGGDVSFKNSHVHSDESLARFLERHRVSKKKKRQLLLLRLRVLLFVAALSQKKKLPGIL